MMSPDPPDDVVARRHEALERALARRGLRHTRQREVLTEIFFKTDGHFSLDELLAMAKTKNAGIGYATVYRTLKLLTELGLAQERQFADGQTRYEATDGQHHHDHLICTRCRKIVEFEEDRIEKLQDEVAERLGFRLSSHKMELYGLCADCQRDSSTDD
jgi:Fur family ferric uptake transcriptional regulator